MRHRLFDQSSPEFQRLLDEEVKVEPIKPAKTILLSDLKQQIKKLKSFYDWSQELIELMSALNDFSKPNNKSSSWDKYWFRRRIKKLSADFLKQLETFSDAKWRLYQEDCTEAEKMLGYFKQENPEDKMHSADCMKALFKVILEQKFFAKVQEDIKINLAALRLHIEAQKGAEPLYAANLLALVDGIEQFYKIKFTEVMQNDNSRNYHLFS